MPSHPAKKQALKKKAAANKKPRVKTKPKPPQKQKSSPVKVAGIRKSKKDAPKSKKKRL